MAFGFVSLVANTSMILIEEFVLKTNTEPNSNMTEIIATASPVNIAVSVY